MSSMLDLLKSYKPNWKEIACRDFRPEEIAAVADGKGVIRMGKFGQSICMIMVATGEKKYLPLEPSSIGVYENDTVIPLSRVQFVNLIYVGDDPEKQNKTCLKARILPKSETETCVNFDNPFGLK